MIDIDSAGFVIVITKAQQQARRSRRELLPYDIFLVGQSQTIVLREVALQTVPVPHSCETHRPFTHHEKF